MPALVGVLVGAAVLLLADETWLRLCAALVLLVAVALAVFAVATPEFVAADREDRE